MTRYIIKRLLYMIPMLFLVVLLVFLIMSFTPGDPASANLPLTTPAAVKEAYNESVGYSASLPVRFLTFLRGLLHGNVPSYSTGDNVFAELARRIPMTLRLGLISFSIAALLGVAMGILSAVKHSGEVIDGGVRIRSPDGFYEGGDDVVMHLAVFVVNGDILLDAFGHSFVVDHYLATLPGKRINHYLQDIQ